jgi:hypothetical protein
MGGGADGQTPGMVALAVLTSPLVGRVPNWSFLATLPLKAWSDSRSWSPSQIDRGILAPCGRCRQMLLDYQPHIRVIIASEGVGCSVSINELLPYANRWSVASGSLPSTRRKFS